MIIQFVKLFKFEELDEKTRERIVDRDSSSHYETETEFIRQDLNTDFSEQARVAGYRDADYFEWDFDYYGWVQWKCGNPDPTVLVERLCPQHKDLVDDLYIYSVDVKNKSVEVESYSGEIEQDILDEIANLILGDMQDVTDNMVKYGHDSYDIDIDEEWLKEYYSANDVLFLCDGTVFNEAWGGEL